MSGSLIKGSVQVHNVHLQFSSCRGTGTKCSCENGILKIFALVLNGGMCQRVALIKSERYFPSSSWEYLHSIERGGSLGVSLVMRKVVGA